MDDIKNFKVNRTQLIREMYADETSRKKRQDETISGYSSSLKDAAAVYEALKQSFNNTENVIDISTKLYAVNPIYKQILDYMSNMYMWRYRVTPHFNIIKQNNNKADFSQIYNLMLEVVDGLSIETKFPAILTKVFMQGATYITTYCDEETLTINTLILPTKYCRKVGETQYGTAIVEFDCSYFDDLGLDEAKLNVFFDSFPAEFLTAYKNYKKDSTLKWAKLDSRFTTGIMCNEFGIPTYLYALGGILDFEKYQSNELERNDNTLKYIVSHKMPIYQDKTVFEMDEVNTLHKSLRKIIDRGEKTRLITTYGDISLLKVAENDTSENQVLSKAFKAIFNNAGLNSAIFTAESVESLKLSLVRDKGIVWNYIQSLLNFYTIAINNWFDFTPYETNIDILPISPYTYNDDIEVYRSNATLGINKIDYIIASGIKQKNINDIFDLESFLKLDRIRPLQSSYTQTAVDRETERTENDKGTSENSGIEPSQK